MPMDKNISYLVVYTLIAKQTHIISVDIDSKKLINVLTDNKLILVFFLLVLSQFSLLLVVSQVCCE